MRGFFALLGVLICAASPAGAQVTVNLHALDALPAAPPALTPPASPAHAAHPGGHAARHTARARTAPPAAHAHAPERAKAVARTTEEPPPAVPAPAPSREAAATAASHTAGSANKPKPASAPVPTPAPPPATIAAAPPPPPAIPAAPAIAQPEAAPPAKPPISVAAASTAASTHGSLTVTFGPGQTDLSPASAAAIAALVRAAPHGRATGFNVLAYAGGNKQDPSKARRLSLSRALAVQGALMADGVPQSSIYLRALGTPSGKGPADRAEISVIGADDPPAPPSPPQRKTS